MTGADSIVGTQDHISSGQGAGPPHVAGRALHAFACKPATSVTRGWTLGRWRSCGANRGPAQALAVFGPGPPPASSSSAVAHVRTGAGQTPRPLGVIHRGRHPAGRLSMSARGQPFLKRDLPCSLYLAADAPLCLKPHANTTMGIAATMA